MRILNQSVSIPNMGETYSTSVNCKDSMRCLGATSSPYVLLPSLDNETCSVFFLKTNDLTNKKQHCLTPLSSLSLPDFSPIHCQIYWKDYSWCLYFLFHPLLSLLPAPPLCLWVLSSLQNVFLLWSLMTFKFQVQWRFLIISWSQSTHLITPYSDYSFLLVPLIQNSEFCPMLQFSHTTYSADMIISTTLTSVSLYVRSCEIPWVPVLVTLALMPSCHQLLTSIANKAWLVSGFIRLIALLPSLTRETTILPCDIFSGLQIPTWAPSLQSHSIVDTAEA